MTASAPWGEGVRYLRDDPAFGPWVERVGPVDDIVSDQPPFEYLVRAIVYQQLAGAAARTIHGRVVEVLDGVVTPAAVGDADPTALRAAGLSAAKLKAIRDLAARAGDGTVDLAPAALDALDDEAVVARLTRVWGVGRWTAEMFLMFRLGRPDVWPVGDLGVRSGWTRIHALAERPDARDLEHAAEHLRPWRSAAAWYCWRALEFSDEDTP